MQMHSFWIVRKKRWVGMAMAAATLLSATSGEQSRAQGTGGTTTRIKHVVVIFQENVSFDHYFATYPNAMNPPGEPAFHTRYGVTFQTPSVNGLTGALMTNNPNGFNPFRLT